MTIHHVAAHIFKVWATDFTRKTSKDGNYSRMVYRINRDEHIILLGVMVRGRPNSLVKKSWVGILHMFTHIPTHPLFSKYLV